MHDLAGKAVPHSLLIHVPRLLTQYYTRRPDPAVASERVSFGTSGHRGSSLDGAFNEAHILAIAQAIAEKRGDWGATGPLYLAMDTHALSEPAHASAIEVFAAHGIPLRIAPEGGYTPTPALSRAILAHNEGRDRDLADGVVITPSHNPPEDGGFKYNPPSGGPAGGEMTGPIEARANELLAAHLEGVPRMPLAAALDAPHVETFDYIDLYVAALDEVVDMAAIREAGIRIGADPMGGAGVGYWAPIAERYDLQIEVVNPRVDPTFSFMRVDRDGKVRMDCSSPSAMAGLIELRESFDIAVGNDPDFDRHGIVTRSGGLMNPNHFLAVAVWYLFQHRPDWPAGAAVGKTLVSSSMIDRVAASLDLRLAEVPVGFKWFVEGLLDGSYGFGGEESAGASFLKRDGTVWTTDKDGIIMALLAAEILARTGRDPSEHYEDLAGRFGRPLYERIDAPASGAQKQVLKQLSPDDVTATTLAGEPIVARLTRAPGNDAPIGGLKVVTENGWFAARPSGTEEIYKIYAESFVDADHLRRLQNEAQEIVGEAFRAAGL